MNKFDPIKWHLDNGGFKGNLAGHACRTLMEMIELCIAAGADAPRIIRAVESELAKAEDRGEFGGNPDDLPQEFADVDMLMRVFAYHAGIDRREARNDKGIILLERDWAVDHEGVLWRPDRVPEPPK